MTEQEVRDFLAQFDKAREDFQNWPQWMQDAAVERAASFPRGVGGKRSCCNAECGWSGYTDRMLGSVGPLCPDCGEVTEPDGAALPDGSQR